MIMNKVACGVDLGGTKLRMGIVNSDGNVIKKTEIPTPKHKSPEAVVDIINCNIRTLLEKANIKQTHLKGIGICVPGFFNPKTKKIFALTNLPGWEGIPIVNIIKEEFYVPVKLGNDAHMAAYGEYLYGAGKGTNNFVYITISTGIGGGVIIEGKPYYGTNHGAAELGHIVIDINGEKCNCGNYGCFEAMASGTAIARYGKRIKNLSENKPIKAEHVFEAAKGGNKIAIDIIEKEAFYIGIGLCNIIAAYNPEMIAIGGGVSNQWDILYPKIMKIIKNRALKHNAKVCEILRSELRGDAGIIGAAASLFFKWI